MSRMYLDTLKGMYRPGLIYVCVVVPDLGYFFFLTLHSSRPFTAASTIRTNSCLLTGTIRRVVIMSRGGHPVRTIITGPRAALQVITVAATLYRKTRWMQVHDDTARGCWSSVSHLSYYRRENRMCLTG